MGCLHRIHHPVPNTMFCARFILEAQYAIFCVAGEAQWTDQREGRPERHQQFK
jgi:hypothetical protein